MSQNKGNNSQQNQPNNQLPANVIEQFLKTQHLNAMNEAEEIKLRSKEIDLQARFAEKSLEIQAQIISNKPSEGRKTVTRLAYIIGGFLTIFFSFVGYCLYIGKDQFVLQFLQIIGYFITTALGYYFGRTKTKNEKSDSQSITSTISDAEIVP
jgi:hypothetical protein